MSQPIKSWSEVHASGETPGPWNRGRRNRAARPEEIAKTKARYRERRRRDVERALAMGVSLAFMETCREYLEGGNGR